MPQKQRWLTLKGGFSLIVKDFTQSLGAELLTNGNFAAWTLDDPDSWTVVGEVVADPAVHQTAPNENHTGIGTGACNLYSSATNNAPGIQQVVLTASNIFEASANITNYVSGNLKIGDSALANALNNQTTGVHRQLFRATNITFYIRASDTAPEDITIDDASVKLITKNTAQNAVADGVFDLYFPIPGSPVAGDRIELIFRMASGTNQELFNCWSANLLRNDANSNWNAQLDRFSSGTRNNHTGATSVGSPNGIRVRVAGSSLKLYTLLNGVETQRGSTVTNSTHISNTIVNTVYTSNFAPTELRLTS